MARPNNFYGLIRPIPNVELIFFLIQSKNLPDWSVHIDSSNRAGVTGSTPERKTKMAFKTRGDIVWVSVKNNYEVEQKKRQYLGDLLEYKLVPPT